MSDWKEALWAELDGQTDTEQFVTTGAWIVEIVQQLLPQLAERRRDRILAILDQDGWDATRLAETTGTRRTTILRLAEEGRATRRRDREPS